jgi:hypothetical protein
MVCSSLYSRKGDHGGEDVLIQRCAEDEQRGLAEWADVDDHLRPYGSDSSGRRGVGLGADVAGHLIMKANSTSIR